MSDRARSGASEKAREAAEFAVDVETGGSDDGDRSARVALGAAHDPALGDARSVNEKWCREDQARQIVEWLRAYKPHESFGFRSTCGSLALAIEREFGGRDG